MRDRPRWGRLGVAVLVSLLAAAALAAPDAPKDAPATRPAGEPAAFTFLHFGDPQIGFGRDGVEADKRRLLEAVREANERKPAFVYIAGDLVHKRTPAEQAAIDEALKAFRVPVVITPGNHDAADHEMLKAFRDKYGPDRMVLTHGNCDFVLVDSMLLSKDSPWFKDKDEQLAAEVQAQWDWLDKALAAARASGRDHVFLLTHVPPFLKSPDEKSGYDTLPKDARARLLALADKCGVRAILVGHDHRTREVPAGDRTIYIVGGTARVGDARGYGFREFRVYRDRVEQEYVRLKLPKELEPPPPTTRPAKRATQPARSAP